MLVKEELTCWETIADSQQLAQWFKKYSAFWLLDASTHFLFFCEMQANKVRLPGLFFSSCGKVVWQLRPVWFVKCKYMNVPSVHTTHMQLP